MVDDTLDPQVAALDWATVKWRQELGEVPDEAVVWQPFPGGHSIGAVILHIAEVEAYYLTEVIGGESRTDEERERLLADQTDQYAVERPTPP